MRKSILLIATLLIGYVATAQQLPQFTSYQLNPYMYNPAVAGVDGHTQMNAVIRNQWSGVREAPETNVISAYGPLRNEKMALGAIVYKDVAHADSRRGISLSYAYHLRLKDDLSLSLGLSGGFLQYKLDHTIINPFDEGDPVLNLPGLTDVVPNASFGAFLYSDNYYVSLAVPQLLNSSFSVVDEFSENELLGGSLTNHYYLGGGYIHELNSTLTIEPSLLLKMAAPAPMQIEVATKVTYKDMLWSAVSYRSGDAATLFVGYDVNDQFYIAYGHDFITSGLNKVSSGTNEFKVGIRFNKSE
jgi:type IX secretion system PorP/SprF family membrane protein